MKNGLQYCKFIKIYVKAGFALAIAAIAVSLILHFFAKKGGDYYLLNEISIELIHTSRKCAATTALGAFLLSLIGR